MFWNGSDFGNDIVVPPLNSTLGASIMLLNDVVSRLRVRLLLFSVSATSLPAGALGGPEGQASPSLHVRAETQRVWRRLDDRDVVFRWYVDASSSRLDDKVVSVKVVSVTSSSELVEGDPLRDRICEAIVELNSAGAIELLELQRVLAEVQGNEGVEDWGLFIDLFGDRVEDAATLVHADKSSALLKVVCNELELAQLISLVPKNDRPHENVP